MRLRLGSLPPSRFAGAGGVRLSGLAFGLRAVDRSASPRGTQIGSGTERGTEIIAAATLTGVVVGGDRP